jgi:hypothetical protein
VPIVSQYSFGGSGFWCFHVGTGSAIELLGDSLSALAVDVLSFWLAAEAWAMASTEEPP